MKPGETPCARHNKMAKCRKRQETRHSPETGRGTVSITLTRLRNAKEAASRSTVLRQSPQKEEENYGTREFAPGEDVPLGRCGTRLLVVVGIRNVTTTYSTPATTNGNRSKPTTIG